MPPRWFVAIVVAAWLAAIGWLVVDRWLPWWRATDEPAFAVDLADEVAPQHSSWVTFRDGKRVGAGDTRLTPRKDGLFELTTKLRDADLRQGPVDVRAASLSMTRVLRRDGSLVSVEAAGKLKVRFLGGDTPVEATATATVVEGRLVGECVVNGQKRFPIGPTPLPARGAFASLQPMTKYAALRPGQSWRLSHVDITHDLLAAAVQVVVGQAMAESFPGQPSSPLIAPPTSVEVLAQVQDGTEVVELRDETVECRLLIFREDRAVVGRQWVDVADGRVVKVEGLGFGGPIVLHRD